MQAAFEFEPDNGRAGYRLCRLELYNWGTFDGRVSSLDFGGGTTLMTGANGSGKTTVVDALLTLLVPNVRRGYNLASGAARKDRDELSYVLGAFGKAGGDAEGGEHPDAARARYLRPVGGRPTYTALLAHFRSEGLGADLTLAQVMWLQNGLQKLHLIASLPLRIKDHLSGFESAAELRRRAGEVGWETFETFRGYSERFREAVGIRSEQALGLFNQTVSLKAVEDLDGFVRAHMLDAEDLREEVEVLRNHFEDLTATHGALVQARDRMDRLRPLVGTADGLGAATRETDELRGCRQALPAFMARREEALVREALRSVEGERAAAEREADEAEVELRELESVERERYTAFVENEVGRRIERLREEAERVRADAQGRRDAADAYAGLARPLGLDVPVDAGAFDRNRQRVDELGAEAEAEWERLEAERRESDYALRQQRQALDGLRAELRSLGERTSGIPSDDVALRQRLATALGVPEGSLPFVGELLRVRPEEAAWEGAAERVLRPFALEVLVADADYDRLTAHVNAAHLGRRLVYRRVRPDGLRDPDEVGAGEADRLYAKLEVRADAPHRAWLINTLRRRFDHVCCSPERFRHVPKALTANGLVKGGDDRHVKDDRHRLDDRRQYVLGWDNTAKQAALAAELEALSREVSVEEERGRAAAERGAQLLRVREGCRDLLLRYERFEAVDWRGREREAAACEAERAGLEASSDALKALQRAHEEAQAQVGLARGRARELSSRCARLDERHQALSQHLTTCLATLGAYAGFEAEVERYAPALEARLPAGGFGLDEVRGVQDRVGRELDGEAGRLEAHEQRLRGRLIRSMTEYKRDYPADTADVDADPASAGAFRRLLVAIERDDLPRHEARFRELLTDKMIEHVSLFADRLDRQERAIKAKVQALNGALRTVPYTAGTHIQLRHTSAADQEVGAFRERLKGVFASVGGPDEDREVLFNRIRALIEWLEEDDRRTRKVIDVRTWLRFWASERDEEDAERARYSDSGGLSGGQKAKLAYTILAAAITYQYGLDAGEARSCSFRFVVIDEAFSKVDEANGRYAMNLFRRLDLQLLVISPDLRVGFLEDYITACHFVWNTPEGECSRVRTMALEDVHAELRRREAARGVTA